MVLVAAVFRSSDRQYSSAVLVRELLETLQMVEAARMPETAVADLMKTRHFGTRYVEHALVVRTAHCSLKKRIKRIPGTSS
jgi:hypothetical protein